MGPIQGGTLGYGRGYTSATSNIGPMTTLSYTESSSPSDVGATGLGMVLTKASYDNGKPETRAHSGSGTEGPVPETIKMTICDCKPMCKSPMKSDF